MGTRRGRRLTIAALALVVVGGTAFAWYMAAGARTPGQRAAQAAPPPRSVITAKVTGGELAERVSLPGVFARASTVPVHGPATVNGGKAIVTKLPVATGGSVGNGTLIAEVSGRPLIGLSGAFPAYRDLGEGDRGPDVTQLQAALRPRYRTPVSGVFDARTADDVRRLYRSAGYEPVLGKAQPPEKPGGEPESPPSAAPDTVRLPATEIAFVAELPATVSTLGAKVGDDANAVLLTLASGAWLVVAALSDGVDRTLTTLPPGARLVLGAGPGQGTTAKLLMTRPAAPATGGTARGGGGGGGTAPATQTTSPPQASPPDSAAQAASEAVFTVDGDVAGIAAGQAQEVVAELRKSPPGTLIVPASALFTRPDGTIEVTVVAGGARRSVVVEMTMSFQGQAAVAVPNGGLAVGDEVVVGEPGP